MSVTWIVAAALSLNLGASHGKTEEFGSRKEAEALVAKGVTSFKKVGVQKTIDEINAKAPGWVYALPGWSGFGSSSGSSSG